jgi:hypothetical protein
VIEQLLSKKPTQRPSSAHEVSALLEPITAPHSATIPPTASSVLANRRPYLSGTLLALSLILVGSVAAYVAWGPDRSKETMPSQTISPTLVVEPLRVLTLDVRHYAALNDKTVEPRGSMGSQSFQALLGDEFDVHARLSRPAYSFIIVFRPDGQDEVLYPQADTEIPVKTESPIYPAKRREDRYVMEEGAGLWLVALVVSEEPLPSYREWKAKQRSLAWQATKGKSGTVWLDDGQLLETLEKGKAPNRGDRASKSASDRTPIVRVVDDLRARSRGTVSAVAFTVDEKR